MIADQLQKLMLLRMLGIYQAINTALISGMQTCQPCVSVSSKTEAPPVQAPCTCPSILEVNDVLSWYSDCVENPVPISYVQPQSTVSAELYQVYDLNAPEPMIYVESHTVGGVQS